MSKSPAEAVDVDDEGDKERLTSKEFVDLIPHLSFAQVLQVEVFFKGTWKRLVDDGGFSPNGLKKYHCTVCSVFQTSKNMIDHISGKKHAAVMERITDIYHPEYTYPKSKLAAIKTPKEKQNVPKKVREKVPDKVTEKVAENLTEKVPEKTLEAKPPSQIKNLVRNPLTLNRSKETTTTSNKPNVTMSHFEQSTIQDDSEIPEVIIIDDNEEQQSMKNSSKESPQKDDEPPKKMPKIMVSSFAKCVESSDDDTSTKSKEKDKDKEKNKANVKSPAKAQPNIDEEKNKIHGFIGVEYVVKVCDDNVPTRYECGLCEQLNFNFDDMQQHLLGYSHRLKFCEKHFPTAIQQFRQYIVDVPAEEHYKVMIPVLQKLAEAIEKHHGRAQPVECHPKRFKTERIRVLTEVFARAHASEQEGPTFTHVVNSKDVDEFISKRNSALHQEKVVKTPIFDCLKPSSANKNKIPIFKRNNQIDSAPIVKMANAMRMHFHMSQPYHVDGPLVAQPYLEPQPYMGQQPYMHQPPFMEQPAPFMPPPYFMGPQPDFNAQPAVDDETHKRMVDKFLKDNKKDGHASSSRSHRHDRKHRNDRHRSDRNAPYHRDSGRSSRHSRSPHRSSSSHSSTSSKPQQSLDIWRSYCRLVDHKLKALDECFKQYKANPETHPSYNQEWLMFWHRRKAELMAEGKDYRTYDYQPEWVLFFNNRVKELYEEAVEELKIKSREELSLPLTNDFVLETKYYVHGKVKEKKKSESQIEPVKIVDLELPSSSGRAHFSTKSHESSAEESGRVVYEKKSAKNNMSIRIEDDETPTFVSVLRLLTALEEHLGSLGPKIVDLLTKALQAEKSSPAHGLALINEENCTLLETAMEKFKGLVIAGILDSAKERALKKAITKVTIFLGVAKKTRELVAKRPAPAVTPATDASPRKQQAIEEKLAALLAAQGRTNFDREKLEQLATVCMLLKKREAATASATESLASTSRGGGGQPSAQKPLSDALSDIMGNFGSSGVTARKPSSNTYADLMSNANNQYQPTSASSSSSLNYTNGNSMNVNRNFGNTYTDNARNSALLNNRNTEPIADWQRNQRQQQQQHQNAPSRWDSTWEAAGQPTVSYPGQPNRPPLGRGPYM